MPAAWHTYQVRRACSCCLRIDERELLPPLHQASDPSFYWCCSSLKSRPGRSTTRRSHRWAAQHVRRFSLTSSAFVAPVRTICRHTGHGTLRGIMATRQARRAANKEGNMYTVKTGFDTIITHQQLAATTLQAVQLVSPDLDSQQRSGKLAVARLTLLRDGRECLQSWSPNWIRHSSATARMRSLSEGSKDTVVVCGDAKFSSSCCKALGLP